MAYSPSLQRRIAPAARPSPIAPLVEDSGRPMVQQDGRPLFASASAGWPRVSTVAQASRERGLRFGLAFTESVRAASAPFALLLAAEADVYVPENDFKPGIIWTSAGVVNLTRPSAFVARAAADQKFYRIHPLLWGINNPAWLNTALNAGNWQGYIDEFFTAVRSAAPSPISIDVVNEAIIDTGYRSNAWLTAAGPSHITYAFQKARELWPSTPLYYCQDGTEMLGSTTLQNRAAQVLSLIAAQKAAGAPIDGIALQGHLDLAGSFDALRLRDYCKAIRETLGCKLIISELDVRTGNTGNYIPANFSNSEYDRLAADLIARFLDVVLPWCTDEFHCWTPSDNQNPWNVGERPGLWDASYVVKPAYGAVRRALLER